MSIISLEVSLPVLFEGIFYTCSFVDNIDLGTACGKYHRVGVLAVTDAGDADLGFDKE